MSFECWLSLKIVEWAGVIESWASLHYAQCRTEQHRRETEKFKSTPDWMAVFWILVLWQVGLAFKYAFGNHRLIVLGLGLVIGVVSVVVRWKHRRAIHARGQEPLAGPCL